MAIEKTIATQTGELVLRISDASPWKEQALAVLCEQTLQRLLGQLGARHGGIVHAVSAQWVGSTTNEGLDGAGHGWG